jgi:glycine oxidase
MHIGIAGAGLVGRVLAINLLEAGHRVELFDKGSKEGTDAAGFTAAGMLAPYAELETAESVIFELGHRSMELWPKLLKAVGLFDGMKRNGTLITAHPQDWGELEQFISVLQYKVDDAAKAIGKLTQQDIALLEPELSHHKQGFFIENEGVVDAQRFIAFSVNYLERMGAPVHEYRPVTKLSAHTLHFADGSQKRFDWVFDARGLGAKEHFGDLRGVRGEVIWVEANDIDITRPVRLMHPRYKLYVVPRGNGCEGIDLEYCKDCKLSQTPGYKRYIIGATEIESEDTTPVSVRSAMELLSALYTVHPGFMEGRIVDLESNCRPAFRDNLPRIEEQEGITRINGLYRHGYLLAPALVEKALKSLNI